MAKDGLRFLGDDDSPVNWNCNILDKESAVFHYIQYMFDRTNVMFQYTGLPDTIPAYLLEYMIQIRGHATIVEHEGKLYAFSAHIGGPPDPYYRTTMSVVANPGLMISDNYRIVNHLPSYDRKKWESMPPCVLFYNDSQLEGLLPLFARYAVQMAENDVSVRSAQINLRQRSIIIADNGPEKESADLYIKNLEDGKLAIIGKRAFVDGIKVESVGNESSDAIIQLIELQQYLKASWYNEIGLNSNFNMKRQYMSSDEVNSSADIMLPLIDNMLECRQRSIEAINKEFGTNISVEKNSAWEKKQLQADLSIALNPENGDPIDLDMVQLTEQQEDKITD